MKKTILFTAALACAAFTAKAEVLFEDTWSTWTTAYQTAYAGGNGSLIADGSSTGGTTLGISGGFAGGVTGTELYTQFAFPTFTFTNNGNWSDVNQLILTITYGGNSNAAANASLALNGDAAQVIPADFYTRPGAVPAEDTDAFTNTYIWDITPDTDVSSLVISFTTIVPHTAISNITLTGVGAAVPEPSTYALILGGVVLGGVAIVRRRRS